MYIFADVGVLKRTFAKCQMLEEDWPLDDNFIRKCDHGLNGNVSTEYKISQYGNVLYMFQTIFAS